MPPAFTGAIGFGGLLEVDPSGGYEDLGMVVDFSVSIEVQEVDTTHKQSDSAAPFFKEFIPGTVRVELAVSLLFDPGDTEHKATIIDILGANKPYRYTFEDGSIWTFTGFARSPTLSFPNADRLSGDLAIRCTGAATFAGAA